MANNRMYLVCNVCAPTDEKCLDNEKANLCLAKWYPESPYYSPRDKEEWVDRFFEFLEQHHHPEVASKHYLAGAGQENPVRLVYERDGLPILDKEKAA